MHGTTPKLWYAVCCEWWDIPDRETGLRVWRAMRESRTPCVAAMATWISQQPFVFVEHFKQRFSPAAVVEVLETLGEERRIRRRELSRMEAAILTHVTHDGEWRGVARPRSQRFAETGSLAA